MPNISSSSSSSSADPSAADHTTSPARAVPQRGCIEHLANRNELRVSGSDSYACSGLHKEQAPKSRDLDHGILKLCNNLTSVTTILSLA